MTGQKAVQLADPTARFIEFGDRVSCGGGETTQPGWVYGERVETRICSSERYAWQMAAEMLAVDPTIYGGKVNRSRVETLPAPRIWEQRRSS